MFVHISILFMSVINLGQCSSNEKPFVTNTGNCCCANLKDIVENATRSVLEEYIARTKSTCTSEPTTSSPLTTEPTTSSPLTTEPTTYPPLPTEPTTSPPLTSEPTTSSPLTTEPTTSPPLPTEPTTFPPLTTEPTTSPPLTYPGDCQEVMEQGNTSTGLYTVYPDGHETSGFEVRCDMETELGGWSVFQRRESNSGFYKTWYQYKKGFGDLNDNFWLGNDKIVSLCGDNSCELRIDMAMDDETKYAQYETFWIENESGNYKLHVSGYSGTAGDSLSYHDNRSFTTMNRDNDGDSSSNCARRFSGAWWHHNCHYSNLNGDYGNTVFGKGLNWKTWAEYTTSLTMTEMKIRRAQHNL